MKIVLAAYGGRGDVEPCAALGRELMRRGHQVRLAVPPNLTGFVESTGLAAVGYGPDTQQGMSVAQELLGSLQWGVGGLSHIVERVTRIWMDKSATLASLATGADLLVAHMNDQALAANVAEHHGVPLAALHVFPARIMPSSPLYSSITQDADVAQRRALGLPERTPTRPAGGPLEIQSYDELCLPAPAADWLEPGGRRPCVGSLTLELPTDTDDEVLSWIADGTPPVYCGFGSTPVSSPAETVAVISAACGQLGERALICSGANDFTDVPLIDHVKVVEAMNYAAVFPACRAVVHHGGSGTTAAGLRAGVPTLILWTVWDQPMWAAAVEQLQVGSGRAFAESTLDSLVADLRMILTPDCAARARELAPRLSTPADSVARAADLLEEQVGAAVVQSPPVV
ncbi:glycosyltransferase [Mycobacterium sp. 94-17]|uniref:glycosyltransferase n=1 Tax=Mycobacterium sp. 94-17 TaxID=2986147 RepID=UPI002D1EB17A|nr:glycosyltransferase [Mycobacterium sp. 94-17]MEB4209868.1 glycosyltransferase [Mycobacterium sp. 94-17]